MRQILIIAAFAATFAFLEYVTAQDISLQRLPSGLDIELQPQGDHHRIRLRVRFRNSQDKQMFVRIDTTPMAGRTRHSELREVEIKSDDEVWDCFLRVPKDTSRTCSYTLWLGETKPDEVDIRRPTTGFHWTIERDANGRATIVAAPDARLPTIVRTAVVEAGGTIRVYVETSVIEYRGIRFGTVQNQDPVEYSLQQIR